MDQETLMKALIPAILPFMLIISSGCAAQNETYVRAPIPTARPTSQVDIGDGGLVSQDPCGPPCLLGITPGQSSLDDVERQLEQYGLMATCEHISVSWSCYSFSSSISIIMDEEKEKVSHIWFYQPGVTLGEVIDTYGDPDVWVMDKHTDTGWFDIELCFNKISTIAELEALESVEYGDHYPAQPSTTITKLVYLDGGCESFYPSFVLEPWTGYGDYPPDSQ
jgi:hypothetical protein